MFKLKKKMGVTKCPLCGTITSLLNNGRSGVCPICSNRESVLEKISAIIMNSDSPVSPDEVHQKLKMYYPVEQIQKFLAQLISRNILELTDNLCVRYKRKPLGK